MAQGEAAGRARGAQLSEGLGADETVCPRLRMPGTVLPMTVTLGWGKGTQVNSMRKAVPLTVRNQLQSGGRSGRGPHLQKMSTKGRIKDLRGQETLFRFGEYQHQ